mmetsp:Transcript_39884/g.93584  ORF Transcript_39884/g.93584 Transcript_39884/m.93584 type:complete len:429 (+) Transcript_39884:316-1602(+)
MRSNVASRRDNDVYWRHIGLLLRQFDGLLKGYNSHVPPGGRPLDELTLYAASLGGDMDDLCVVYGCEGSRRTVRHGDDHCSVLIKLMGDRKRPEDLYVAHTTWGSYESMTRIYKHYDFPWRLSDSQDDLVPARHITMPSYPGVLVSQDDFYQTSAGLVVTETTNANHNRHLWSALSPHSVSDWARNMVANRLATTGHEWMQIYSRYNSGTYNNQWMVVDMNRLHNGHVSSGLLSVLEQMPGVIESADMTEWLTDHGHWVSYNRPFFPKIFNVSGQREMVAKYGPHYSWNETARAVLFRHLIPQVVSEETLQRIMRHNDYEHDVVGTQDCKSGRSASNAIAERGDLTLLSAECIPDISQIDEGAIDAKYTTFRMFQAGRLGVSAVSGPPYGDVSPFVWSTSPFANVSHVGQQDGPWEYPWVKMEWTLET